MFHPSSTALCITHRLHPAVVLGVHTPFCKHWHHFRHSSIPINGLFSCLVLSSFLFFSNLRETELLFLPSKSYGTVSAFYFILFCFFISQPWTCLKEFWFYELAKKQQQNKKKKKHNYAPLLMFQCPSTTLPIWEPYLTTISQHESVILS